MSQIASVGEMSRAITNLGSAAAANAGVLIPPMGFMALGGGGGFVLSDLLSETVKTAANLTGRGAVVAEVATKGVVGTGLLGLGWRMAKLGPLSKIGVFAAGAGCFISAIVDVTKYFLPVEDWGRTLGDRIRSWLKLGEVAIEGANRMSRSEYEKLLAQQRSQNPSSGQTQLIKL